MPKPANGRRRCSIKNQRCLATSGGVSGRGSGGRRRRSKDCQREARYGFVEGDFFAAFAAIGGPVALAASMSTNVSPNMPAVSSKTVESFGMFSSYGG